jgi:hypothetical protein
MADHAFNVAAFRAQFPEFANSTTYPDATLEGYWTMATNYISPGDSLYGLAGSNLDLALNLMTAHLARSFMMLNAGQTTAVVTGSSEGSVSVSLTPPPVKNAWQWWLATTPYGMQLRALLQALAMKLPYVGGSLERASFRKAGGVF